MTAVKENGQLYFTFEELNLEQEIITIQKEIDTLYPTLAEIYETHPKTYKVLRDRIKLLFQIKDNIIRLHEVYNYA